MSTTSAPHEAGKAGEAAAHAAPQRWLGAVGAWLRETRGGRGSPFATLRRRLVITNVVVVAVVLAVLCAIFYTYEARSTQTQVDQQLVGEAQHEAAKGLPGPETGPDEEERPYAPGSPNLFSIALAAPHRVVQDDDQIGRLGLPDWVSAAPVLAGTQPSTYATVARDGARYRLYTVPIRSGGTIVGAVQSGTSLAIYDDHLQDLRIILSLLSISVLLLTTILSVYLAERALKPARLAFARQRQFAAAASHELRTPLAFIRSQAELIATADQDGDRPDMPDVKEGVTADAREILTEVDYLTRMTRDLLLLARDEHDARVLSMKPVDFAALACEAAATVRPLAEERGVRLAVEVNRAADAGAVTVNGDADRLRQLVLILLDNAIRYTPAGGSVSLLLRAERRPHLGGQHAGRAVMSVRDTGVGIEESELARIFEPFYRASTPRPHVRDMHDASDASDASDNTSGTGLGLALAQWIAHAHGGTITVRSTPGKGSAFTVMLPLTDRRTEVAGD